MKLPTAILLGIVATTGSAPAAPLVLYDPGTATPTAPGADLKAQTTTGVLQPCGLTTPCTDLNTSTKASLAAPLAGDFEYGMSGVASAGVSNHGQGGSLGVLGWIKAGDSTLYVGLSVGESRFTGPKYTYVPVARP